MAERLKGKVALVSGAGSSGPGWGNGKATAVLFAREGAKVFAVDRNLEAARETEAIIQGEDGESTAYAADVSVAAKVEAMVAACVERYGRIDILHNNVGITHFSGAMETSEEEWDRLLAVNVKSMFLTCKHVLPVMERQGKGVIVNISSVTSIRGSVGHPIFAYSTSKAAVNQLTRSIAMEYAGRGIRANCILPGFMDTPMIREPLTATYGPERLEEMLRWRHTRAPMGRMGDAWDVAYAALFLASDESGYITGIELIVDGGLTCQVG